MSRQHAAQRIPEGVQKNSVKAWILATRPATLTVGLIPVLVGCAIARSMHALRICPALAALFGAIFIQIGTNLANDVFDYEKGADTAERLGPLRVTQAGLIAPHNVRLGMYISFALATVLGLYLTWSAGPVILIIGLLSIASGIAYTGGPYPLGYNGLGDLFVFLFFGFVAVCGTVFVQAGSVPALAVWASIPVGAIATAVLVVNNLRDGATDVVAGKRTLVVRFGRSFGVSEYVGLVMLAYVVPVLLMMTGQCGRAVLLPLMTLPLALPLVRSVSQDSGAQLNQTLAKTAQLLLFHGILFAIGLAQ